MNPIRGKQVRYEAVPAEASASFTCREFHWPHFPFNWHYHPEVELLLILKGTGLRFVGDSVREFTTGDLCLLGANTPHCWASHPRAPRGVRSLAIQFRPENWGAPFWQLPELRDVRQLIDQARRGLLVTGATRRTASEQVLKMLKQPAGSFQRLAGLMAILARLAGSRDLLPLASSSYDSGTNRRTDQKLGDVLGFIHEHLGQELTQEQVARAVRLSPPSFSRFFKRAMGKTYVSYVNELKIRNACRALIESDQPITEIAYEAGFNNLSHFNEQFRRLKQMSPRVYRQRAQSGATHDPLGSASDWLGSFK